MASSGGRSRFEVGSAKVLSFIKEISTANNDDGMLLFEQTEDELVWFIVTVNPPHAPPSHCVSFSFKRTEHVHDKRE